MDGRSVERHERYVKEKAAKPFSPITPAQRRVAELALVAILGERFF
jgi:hypothetical protein